MPHQEALRVDRRHANATASSSAPLTTEEIYGLQYAAGFILWPLKKKLKKSRHPLCNSLLLCLFDLLDERDENADTFAAWITEIN